MPLFLAFYLLCPSSNISNMSVGLGLSGYCEAQPPTPSHYEGGGKGRAGNLGLGKYNVRHETEIKPLVLDRVFFPHNLFPLSFS